MKAIMISIKPQHVANILNGLKTLEIRKRFPIDYVGWVYIYVTKDTKDFLCEVDDYKELHEKGLAPFHYYLTPKRESKYHKCLNGKVVARFWCDKVEEIFWQQDFSNPYITDEFELITFSLSNHNLCNKSCLDNWDLINYLDKDCDGTFVGKAIHITKVEPFDKPKEIKEFHKPSWAKVRYKTMREEEVKQYRLSSAPQSWYYIEV